MNESRRSSSFSPRNPSEQNRSSTRVRNAFYLCALAHSHSQIASLQMMDLRERISVACY
jgi:hypothetical protein